MRKEGVGRKKTYNNNNNKTKLKRINGFNCNLKTYIMRLLEPYDDMYKIRHLLGLSLNALNDQLELYMACIWHQKLTRKTVVVNNGFEQRLFSLNSAEKVFSDMENFIESFDQGHFWKMSEDELLKEVRKEMIKFFQT